MITASASPMFWSACQTPGGISSDRQFLGLVGRVLPGWFPHLPEQSQCNRRLRGLVELISIVQQQLARWFDVGGARLADGTQLAVANYPGASSGATSPAFAATATRARSTASSGRAAGPLTDARGLPLGYTIVPANEHEYEPLADLSTGTPSEIVIADKGFWGRGYSERLASRRHRPAHPDKTRTAANLGRERALASTRLVIESVFANLKGQMRLEQHLAKTPAGLALRIAQRILALTLGILLNTLTGRPARALAAYDGR